MIAAPATLEEIRDDHAGAVYPRAILGGCHTALVVFAAGFFGRQDAYWIAEANLHATCIDTDAERLDAMAAVYPTGWDFIEADAYRWVERATGRWDVVSVDCPTGHFEKCADMLPVWCRLATRAVVLGTGPNHDALTSPPGWRLLEARRRSDYVPGGVWWAVLEAV